MTEGKYSARRNILENIYGQGIHDEVAHPNSLPSDGQNFQRRLLVLTAILASGALIFGLWFTGKKIFRPINSIMVQGAPEQMLDTNQSQNIGNYVQVNTTDTDGDGLTDIDETSIYQTSPYLEDTDSDGVNDGAEIAAKTDPNCLPSTPCAKPGGTTVTAQATTLVQPLGVQPQAQVDVKQMRQMLKDGGVDPAYLDNLSDSELLSLVASVANSNENTDTSADAAVDVSTMTPQQLRSFLRQNGVAENVIQSFSDQDLVSLVKEVQTGN